MEKDIVEDEIDLRDYLNVIWKNKLLIMGIVLVSLISAGIYSFFVLQDEYQTNAILYVNSLPGDLSNAERYSNPAIIATFTSNDLIAKTVEQSGLAKTEPFKDSDKPNENAMIWLKKYLLFTDKSKLKDKFVDKQIEILLEGTMDPEILKNTLSTHIKLVKEENKKRLTDDAKKDIEKIDMQSASLIEQRANILKSIENIPDVNSTDRTVALELFITLNSRLTAIDDRLNAMQLSKKNLELITSKDFNWIEVMSSPYKPIEPVGPKRMLNLAIAGVLGLFIGVFAAFFKNYIEGSVSN
jgi:capsular polysaccharide biosynthesis protein